MTCIIALEYKGKVYMGGDSAAVGGSEIQAVANPKVFRVDDVLIGYTSSFRMGQLLQYSLKVPENTCGDDLRYLVTEFIPAVRECLKSGGYAKIDNNREVGGFFLIGYRAKAYLVGSDFQVTRMTDGFLAVGVGQEFALGALAAMEIRNPKKCILQALEVVSRFSTGVCAPFHIISL